MGSGTQGNQWIGSVLFCANKYQAFIIGYGLQSAPLLGSDAIGHPKVAAFREDTKGWFAFDTARRMADERVHPWPSLHRLVLCPDRELDFSVNRQTPCL